MRLMFLAMLFTQAFDKMAVLVDLVSIDLLISVSVTSLTSKHLNNVPAERTPPVKRLVFLILAFPGIFFFFFF